MTALVHGRGVPAGRAHGPWPLHIPHSLACGDGTWAYGPAVSPARRICSQRPRAGSGRPAVLLGALCLHYVLVPCSPPLTPHPLGEVAWKACKAGFGSEYFRVSVALTGNWKGFSTISVSARRRLWGNQNSPSAKRQGGGLAHGSLAVEGLTPTFRGPPFWFPLPRDSEAWPREWAGRSSPLGLLL